MTSATVHPTGAPMGALDQPINSGSALLDISIPTVVSQEEESSQSSNDELQKTKTNLPNDRNKRQREEENSCGRNGFRASSPIVSSGKPPKPMARMQAPTPPRRSPRRHSLSALPSAQSSPLIHSKLDIPTSSRRASKRPKLPLPPLAPPSTPRQITIPAVKPQVTAQTLCTKFDVQDVKEEDVKTPPSSNMKPLISKTPLREDGTPIQPQKERPVYDSGDEMNSEDDIDTTGLPAVSSSQISSPILQKPAKIQRNENSVSGAQSSITSRQLEQRMVQLFPRLADKRIGDMTCVAARLFAGFSFHLEETRPYASDTRSSQPPARKRSRRKAAEQESLGLIESMKPIMKFLTALVDLELSLLQDCKGQPNKSHLSSRQATTRKVHFAAFDGSAMLPPSDVMEESVLHQQVAVDSLENVIGTLETVQGAEAHTQLEVLAAYLTGPMYMNVDCTEDGCHITACAESLSGRFGTYPVGRVRKAASTYARDLRYLLDFDPSFEKVALLSWHSRLADASAQLVRYWLRTLLNPVPGRAMPNSNSFWSLRVCDFIEFQPSSDDSMAAVDDGSLSSLVSNAASHVFHQFGDDWKLWKDKLKECPEVFLSSDLCTRGIAPSEKRRDSGPSLREWTEEDWRKVEEDVEMSTGVLAAINGAKFLYELLSIVTEMIESMKSWEKTIQEYAVRLHRCRKDSLQSQDAHLVLLRWSPQTLLEQLPAIIDWTRKEACESGLRGLKKKMMFGCDGKKARRKRAYQPYVGQIEAVYNQAISRTFFPGVQWGEDESDIED